MNNRQSTEKHDADRFIEAKQKKRPSLVSELWAFLKCNKKWWLAPIIIVFLALGTLVMLSGTAVAPFIYSLF